MLVHEKGIFCHFSGIFVDKPFAYHIDIYRKLPKQYNNSKGCYSPPLKNTHECHKGFLHF